MESANALTCNNDDTNGFLYQGHIPFPARIHRSLYQFGYFQCHISVE